MHSSEGDRIRYARHAAVFAALANPTRYELMHLLCLEPRTPSELAAALEISRPNVSQHLALLQREGLVRRSRSRSERLPGAHGRGRVLWEVVDPRLSRICEFFDQIVAPRSAQRADDIDPNQREVL